MKIIFLFILFSFTYADCTNDDKVILFKDNFYEILFRCAEKHWAVSDPTSICIADKMGLSMECAKCFGDSCACGRKNCYLSCFENECSQGCQDCSRPVCAPELVKCTNLDVPDPCVSSFCNGKCAVTPPPPHMPSIFET
eukprot:GHVL01039871.1.p1 GENE.GHVL01039871.1~~GHVL01039871.1.p1  ORF type:complete len:139 (+),score=20.15 GHVL01039871.1:36-452(+)